MNTLIFTDIPGKYPYLCALLCAGALLASCLEDSSTSRPFLVAITSVLTICSVLMAEVHRRGYTDHLMVLSGLHTGTAFIFGCIIGEHSNETTAGLTLVSLALVTFFISASAVFVEQMRKSQVMPAQFDQ
mgnify:CR=1 FL=1